MGNEAEAFGYLLDRHLLRGTRPSSSPGRHGKPWTIKEFASAVGASERLVRYWRQGNHLPGNLAVLEAALFGENDDWQTQRTAFREAYGHARSGQQRRPPSQQPSYSILFLPQAELDLKNKRGSRREISSYLEEEVERHPGLFSAEFSSMPFTFGKSVLIVSFNLKTIIVERVDVDLMGPISMMWSSVLSQYRVTSSLPYRKSSVPKIDIRVDVILQRYSRLVDSTILYLNEYGKAYGGVPETGYLVDLLEEIRQYAEISSSASLLVTAELLLSTIHKLLVAHVPEKNYENPFQRADEEPVLIGIAQNGVTDAEGVTKKILIMEDEEMIRLMIRDMCEEILSSAILLQAGTTAEAFAFLVNERVDVLCADINMNGVSGFGVMLAAKKCSPNTKIIVCSGYGQSSMPETLKSVVSHFLQKPFRIEELKAALLDVLGRKSIRENS
jgi:two-component system chemotaxis response regulator CheY